jgi:hypothetical protein
MCASVEQMYTWFSMVNMKSMFGKVAAIVFLKNLNFLKKN